MEKKSKIFVAGHRGLVGSAIIRRLEEQGYEKIITRRSSELDLRRQAETEAFFEAERPEYVFLAAAHVGGILANNTYKADFIYDNLMIVANVVHASHRFGVKKLLNLGSSCIYPKFAPQPLKESYLLTDSLEPTNEPYAIAKIAGIKLCQYYNEQFGTNFLSAMPTNMYGPNDNFDLHSSHVLPAMIRKIHEAKIRRTNVVLWGDGSPRREFLFSDDLAEALLFLMETKNSEELGSFINIGSGQDVSISELAGLVSKVVGFDAGFEWDTSKPNGTPRKLMDVTRINALGWKSKTDLIRGIELTYKWFLENVE